MQRDLAEIRTHIASLIWVGSDEEGWESFGTEGYELHRDSDGEIHIWAEGEGPIYTDFDSAKNAMEEHHRDCVMRFFK